MSLFGAFNQIGPMGAMGGMMGQPAYGQPQQPSAATYFNAPALQMGSAPHGTYGVPQMTSGTMGAAPAGGMGGAIGSMLPHLLGGAGGGMGGAMSSLVPQAMGQPGGPGLGGSMASLVPQVMGQPQVQGAPSPMQPAPQPGMGMAAPFQRLLSQFGPIGGMSPSSMPGNVGALMGGAGRWAPFGSMGAFG